MSAENTLLKIRDILYPKDDSKHDWSLDTTRDIDEVVRDYFRQVPDFS